MTSFAEFNLQSIGARILKIHPPINEIHIFTFMLLFATVRRSLRLDNERARKQSALLLLDLHVLAKPGPLL